MQESGSMQGLIRLLQTHLLNKSVIRDKNIPANKHLPTKVKLQAASFGENHCFPKISNPLKWEIAGIIPGRACRALLRMVCIGSQGSMAPNGTI